MRREHSALHFGSGCLPYTRVVHPVSPGPSPSSWASSLKRCICIRERTHAAAAGGVKARPRPGWRGQTRTRDLSGGGQSEAGRDRGVSPPLLNGTRLCLVCAAVLPCPPPLFCVPIAFRGPVCSVPWGRPHFASCTEPEWPSRASPARPSSAPASFQTRCTLPHCRPRTDRCTDRPRGRFECIPFVALFNAARLGVCRTRKATGTLGWASGKRGLRCWGCGGRRRRRVCVHACRTARRSRRTSRSRPPAASRPAERRATGRSVRIGAAGHVVTARSAAMRPAPIAANCRERARVGRRCAGRSSPSARKLGMLTMG